MAKGGKARRKTVAVDLAAVAAAGGGGGLMSLEEVDRRLLDKS